jgi:hypothetical protein
MSLVRNIDRALKPTAGTGHIGRLGIELLGSHNDLVVGTSLRLVRSHDVPMAEGPKGCRDGLSFLGLNSSIVAHSPNRQNVAVNEAGLAIISANKNLLARRYLKFSRGVDSEPRCVTGRVDSIGLTSKEKATGFHRVHYKGLTSSSRPCRRMELDHHSWRVIGCFLPLLEGPVQRIVYTQLVLLC